MILFDDVLVYKVLYGLALQYLGPLNHVADLPGRRPLHSAGTNRLPVPPVKLTTVANQPGFPGCRPTDMERSARRRDFSDLKLTCLPNLFPNYSLDWTSPNLSLSLSL